MFYAFWVFNSTGDEVGLDSPEKMDQVLKRVGVLLFSHLLFASAKVT